MPVPLTVLDSPYRDITGPVAGLRRGRYDRASPRDLVVVYIPEYVVGRWWEHLLHNQSALCGSRPGCCSSGGSWSSACRGSCAPAGPNEQQTPVPALHRQPATERVGAVWTMPAWRLPATRWPRQHARRAPGGAGLVVAIAGPAAVSAALLPLRQHVSLASVMLLFLVPVVATSVSGGVRPGLLGAVVADVLVNFFFVPPYHTLAVGSAAMSSSWSCTSGRVHCGHRGRHRRPATGRRRTAGRRGGPTGPHQRRTGTGEDVADRTAGQVRTAYAMTAVSTPSEDGVVVGRAGPTQTGPPALTVPAATTLTLTSWGPRCSLRTGGSCAGSPWPRHDLAKARTTGGPGRSGPRAGRDRPTARGPARRGRP